MPSLLVFSIISRQITADDKGNKKIKKKKKKRKLYKVMKLNNIKYCETKLTQDSSLNYLNWQEMIRLFVTRKHLFYTAKYKTFLVPLNIYHLINRVMNIVLKLRKIVGHCCS